MCESFQNTVLAQYLPDQKSEVLREDVVEILHHNIHKCLPEALIYNIGSFPFKTYLPDSDVDLTVIIGPVTQDMELNVLQCIEQQLEFLSTIRPQYNILKLSLIQANVNVLKGIIKGISFDISVNQHASSYSLWFLQAAETHFTNHFFRDCIILAKAWAMHEARIAGSAMGLLSSYAIEVLVLYVLNCCQAPQTPEGVLGVLVEQFSKIDWTGSIVRYNGISPVYGGASEDCQSLIPAEIAQSANEAYLDYLVSYGYSMPPASADYLYVNIIDPVIPTNNLGKCISQANMRRITAAFRLAAERLQKGGVKSLFTSDSRQNL